jgi:hypothetical protein
MNVDELLRAKAKPGSGIRDLIENPAADVVTDLHGELAIEHLAPLPRPGDEYKAHARAANKPVLTIRFLLADAAIRGFPYANLDGVDLAAGGAPGGAPAIVLRFAGLRPTEATLEGRNLDRLYDMLGHHRIAWVRELPTRRDFKEAGEPVINRISFAVLEA